MTTAATNLLALAQNNLRVSLADCATFRTWVGAEGDDSQQQARDRIHDEGLPEPPLGVTFGLADLQALRPHAVISTLGLHSEHGSTGSVFGFDDSGILVLRLEQDVPQDIAHDMAEIGRRFTNTIGAIWDELKALSGGGGYLAIESIDMPEPWGRSAEQDAESMGDFVRVELTITWGGG